MDPGPRSHHHHPPPQPHAGGGGGEGREDFWSEGASEALIEVGNRYLQLSGEPPAEQLQRGRRPVNERQEALEKHRKTDVQCKNRIDTRLEKSKPGPSQRPFFSRLDLLIGPKSAPSLKKSNPSSVPFIKPPYPPPNTHCRPYLASVIKYRNPNSDAAVSSSGLMNSLGSSESSHGEFDRVKDDEEEDENDGDAATKWA